MLKQHHSLDDPKTGVPSDLYKSNWETIFGNKQGAQGWRKRQIEELQPCYFCGSVEARENCTDRTGCPKAMRESK